MKPPERPSSTWESLGEVDADWAVASRDDRMHGGWQEAQPEFYATGKARLEEAYLHVGALAEVQRVLDYGSGTGRLTFNLADRFEHVTAADISLTMLKELQSRALERGITNVDYVDLAVQRPSSDYDLVVCLITLQHISSWGEVDEALSTIATALRAGGRAVLDFPTRPNSWRRRLQLKLRAYQVLGRIGVPHDRLHRRGLTGISMRFSSEKRFNRRLQRAGLTTISQRSWAGSFYVQTEYVVGASSRGDARE